MSTYQMSPGRFRKFAPAIMFAVSLASAGPAAADDLVAAVKANDANHVLALLRAGADPNQHSSYEVPMHVASALGLTKIVTALLDAGADLQARGFGGLSPLHTAVLSGKTAVVEILVERGAKVEALDNIGRTPLLTYASSGSTNLEVLQILLEAGANPNATEPASTLSVLDYVAIRGKIDEAKLLVAAGANANASNNLYGETPLHFALNCSKGAIGNHALVEFLIVHGADVNIRDNRGHTPLDYVRRCTPNNGLMFDILAKAGAH